MKKFFTFIASVALIFAASCNKAEIAPSIEPENTPNEEAVVDETPAQTELLTVVLNPATKTSLSDKQTVWSEGDEVSVTVDGKVIGTLALVEGNTFSGKVEAGHEGKAVLNYPAGVTAVPAEQSAVEGSFANGAALLVGTTTLDDLRSGKGATLDNTTALLSFSVKVAGDVAFTLGNTTYTVKGCEANKTYCVCVDPADAGKLSYAVGIVLGANQKSNFTPEAGKMYTLGELALKENGIFTVCGDNNSWGDTMMYETSEDNLFVAYGVNFSSNGKFKIRKYNTWVDDYNYGTTTTTKKSVNSVVGVYTDGGSLDIQVYAGTYDIYFNRIAGQVYIMEQGKSYTEATQPTTTTKYSLAGNFAGGGWDDTVEMKYSGDGIWTNVQTFAANNEFKIKNYGNWNSSWGYNNVTPGKNLVSYSGGNAKVTTAGTYIVGFYKNSNKITLVKK